MSSNPYPFHKAIQDFESARQRAALQEILARFTGKSSQLLSYEEVAEKLKLRGRSDRGLQPIPLDAIVGSVGRYTDFTRTFLPRRLEDQERWARIKAAMENGVAMPPVEVYKVGEAYFVADGNHRVSIARREGAHFIEAHVIELRTDVEVTPALQVDDLIIKSEYADFLGATRIHEARPNVDLAVTSACQYGKLMDQVRITQYLLQQEAQQAGSAEGAISLEAAAAAWYDAAYIPLAEAIRDRGLLHWFPGRTITDLYIWIAENRAALEDELGWQIQSDVAATDLILEKSTKTETGSWRKARTVVRYTDHLFNDILVPLSGDADSWESLEQAITIAQREGAKLHGLHVVDRAADLASPEALAVQEQFHRRCAEAGVHGRLATEAGEVTRKICERATMTDLIVLQVAHPPASGLAALRSPFRLILADSSRPVLGVPARATRWQRALLAYDGSELAKEALFVAAYLGEIWKTELLVYTAQEGTRVTVQAQDYVRRYLEIHEVEAECIFSEQGARDGLKRTVEERDVELVLMGSHGGTVVRQVLIGSSLDYMLRESKIPLFICR